jgi:hypothetical protein
MRQKRHYEKSEFVWNEKLSFHGKPQQTRGMRRNHVLEDHNRPGLGSQPSQIPPRLAFVVLIPVFLVTAVNAAASNPAVPAANTAGLGNYSASPASARQLSWNWNSCRIAPPLASAEDKPLLVFTSVLVGHHCTRIGDGDVVPATHLSVDRIPSLFRLVRTWTAPRLHGPLVRPGCVSASFGAPTPDALAALRDALAAAPEIAEHLTIHIVIGPRVSRLHAAHYCTRCPT